MRRSLIQVGSAVRKKIAEDDGSYKIGKQFFTSRSGIINFAYSRIPQNWSYLNIVVPRHVYLGKEKNNEGHF